MSVKRGVNLTFFLSEKGVFFSIMDLGGCVPLSQVHPPGKKRNGPLSKCLCGSNLNAINSCKKFLQSF